MSSDRFALISSNQVAPVSPATCDLSILIVNWNTCALLADCLTSVIGNQIPVRSDPSSIAAHRSPLTEVIVVDNASTDGSAAMVREHFPGVQLIENRENVGFARANNQAICHSRGRYVLLLNSDTVVPSGALQALIAFAEAHLRAGIIGVRLVNPDGSFQAGPNRFPTAASVLLETWGVIQRISRNAYYPSFPPERCKLPIACDWVGGACLLARRTAIDQVGMLDERFFMNSEEVDWCYRMHQQGWEVWYTPDATVIHHGGASAKRSTSAQRLCNYRGKVLFLLKHRSVAAGRLAQLNFRFASLCKAANFQVLSIVRPNLSYREQAMSHWAVARETSWPQKS